MSPDDRIQELHTKLDDYLNFGIPCIWVIDPRSGRAYMYTSAGVEQAREELRAGEIRVPLSAILP